VSTRERSADESETSMSVCNFALDRRLRASGDANSKPLQVARMIEERCL